MPDLKEYRLTFGLRYADERHPSFPPANPRGWVTVLAPDYEGARTVATKRVGQDWAFLYPATELRSSRYPLGEIARWSSADPSPAASEPARVASGLLESVTQDEVHHVIVMRLYCWPCRMVHALPLADVERIVYALGAAEACARNDDQVPAQGPEDFGTQCLVFVLRSAGDAEAYAEHVEQGVTCRALGVTA